MQITVVGMGYVGTVAAACLADSGNDVVVVDINPTKIAQLNTGQSPVMEFGLAELIAQNVERGRLHATDDLEHSFLNSEATIICVGTPSGPLGDWTGSSTSWAMRSRRPISGISCCSPRPSRLEPPRAG